VADEGWIRLGETIRKERSRRWPRRPDFARACGLGMRVVTALERHERTNFTDETIAAVEAALGWEPGSADRVRAGLRPRRLEDPDFARLRGLWPLLSPDARRMLVRLAEDAVHDR
jgi:hypothetical protein